MLSEKLLSLAPLPVSLPVDQPLPNPSQQTIQPDVPLPIQSPPRVLLCEDDADLRSVLRAFLQHEGYDVLACGDGQRALELCQSGVAIDLIISDLDMPLLDGLALAKAVSSSHDRLPIILMSGLELDAEKQEYVTAAGWQFFAKPFTLLAMLAAVHNALQHATVAQEN